MKYETASKNKDAIFMDGAAVTGRLGNLDLGKYERGSEPSSVSRFSKSLPFPAGGVEYMFFGGSKMGIRVYDCSELEKDTAVVIATTDGNIEPVSLVYEFISLAGGQERINSRDLLDRFLEFESKRLEEKGYEVIK